MYKQQHPALPSHYSWNSVAKRSSRAILLCDDTLTDEQRYLSALLDFFEIPWTEVSHTELIRECSRANSDGDTGYCILSSASSMAAVVQAIPGSAAALPIEILNANSVYIYGFGETQSSRLLLKLVTGTDDVDIRKAEARATRVSVTDNFPGMCGPMSGIDVSIRLTDKDYCFDVQHQARGFQRIVTADCGEIFASVICNGVPFFLNTCSEVIDIGATAARFFDVKDHFCSAVPITFYLKWAFANLRPIGTETRACLIVDDPLLKPRYGFMRFRDALELMDSHNFTTTIAFIPWNWRRTNPETVLQFQQRVDRLSICVHGCDHTAGEFAARSTALLNRRIKIAGRRMELLSQKTLLQPDRVMVFPQGAFSPEAGRALKLSGFVAAVNTEVAPSGAVPNHTTIADNWNLANMKYGTFPIFTRRYLEHGIENFAFDGLLGKPCLIVAHHEIFRDLGRELAEFVDRLNSLRWNLRWCSLGDAVRHGFKRHVNSGGEQKIQMYAHHVVIENSSTERREAVVMKEESDPECARVVVNQESIDHVFEGKQLQFRITIPPGESADVSIAYLDNSELDCDNDGFTYRVKTRARRHLSEFRDNYVAQNNLLHSIATRVRKLLS
jgi:hypothetical protein